ncbi:MAG: PIN domain-containing protein [Candidatus Dormibacteria bacterium]
MGTLLDTTVFVQLERELSGQAAGGAMAEISRRLVRELGSEEEVGIATVTAAELLHGVHRAQAREHRVRREAFVDAVIEAFPPIPFDLRAARVLGRLWAELAVTGSDIGAHDRIVAATAIASGWRVATSNLRHFEKVAGLVVFEPALSS